MNGLQVITVCARSKFPKSLDADLPSMPLGALWVEQTRDGNNGGGSSSSGTGAGSESAKTGSGKDTDQSQDGPENNAAQSASVEEKWGSASSGSGGSSISVVTGANEAEKEGQRHDKHMSSVDTGAGADVGAMYAGVGEGEASMVEAVCDTQAVAPAAPAGLLIAQKSMKVRGDTGEPVAERCSEASAGEKISVANQEEAADRTDGCAVGIIACSSGHDDGDRDGSRVRNVQDDDDNDDRHVAELSSAARSGGAVLKAKSEKHKDKVNVSSAQDVGKGGKRGGMMVREMDYCTLLNRVLPPEIRALAWAPVTDDFSARFSCSDRTYR